MVVRAFPVRLALDVCYRRPASGRPGAGDFQALSVPGGARGEYPGCQSDGVEHDVRFVVQLLQPAVLSLASADDGKLVFAGSFSSNVWVSEDGGDSWAQIDWPQPVAGQFGVPGAIGGSCVPSVAVSAGLVPLFRRAQSAHRRRHHRRSPRPISWASATPACGPRGVRVTARSSRRRWCSRTSASAAGGWHIDKHPRFLADLRGNGRADIVGFGDAGVYIALSNGDGTFGPVRFVLADFGEQAGGWHVDKHPRFVVDITGNGRADIVGFGDAGVYVALGNGDGTFQPVRFVLADFGLEGGGWRVDRHPRFVVDITGNGRADIVGFGDAGVYIALGNGDGTFQPTQFVIADFGYASGWRVDMHPRLLADLRRSGRADIVGFGNAGVYVALSNGNGTFTFQPQPVLADFGFEAGGWRVDQHPRFLANVRGNGRSDIVGFGNAGVYVALSNGDGTFQPARLVIADFGAEAGGWHVDRHPRLLADLRGIGRKDIVGFGDAGVYVALANRDGTFEGPRFVLPNFGYEATVLALVRDDREAQDAGIWRSSDRGRTWNLVHPFPRTTGVALLPGAGEIEWAPGTANFVYAASGNALAVSRDAGATFQNVMPMAQGGFQAINHVAVAATPPGALTPPVVYALVNSRMFVSFDAGATWIADLGTLPARVGGAVGLFNAPAAKVLVVSPRSPLEVFVTANEVGSATQSPGVFRGDYLQFLGTKTSLWESVVLPISASSSAACASWRRRSPATATCSSTVRSVRRHSSRRSIPRVPRTGTSSTMAQHVHQDLHGVYLSPISKRRSKTARTSTCKAPSG